MELFWILLLIPVVLAFVNPISAVFGLGLWLYEFNFTTAVVILCVVHFWGVGVFKNYIRRHDVDPPAYTTIFIAVSTVAMLIMGIVSRVS